jgi:hypothetical protein
MAAAVGESSLKLGVVADLCDAIAAMVQARGQEAAPAIRRMGLQLHRQRQRELAVQLHRIGRLRRLAV